MASLQCFLIVDSAAWVDKAQQIQTWSYHKTTTFARSHLSLSKLYKNQRKWYVCRNPLNTKVQSSSASAKSRAQLFLGGTQGNIQLRSSNLPWQIRCESRISTLRMRKFVWILTYVLANSSCVWHTCYEGTVPYKVILLSIMSFPYMQIHNMGLAYSTNPSYSL